MKKSYIILFSLLLCCSSALAAASFCNSSSKKRDVEFINSNSKDFNCVISWSSKSGEEHSLEINYLKKYCEKIEGGDLEDCLMARECTNQAKDEISYGPNTLLNKTVLSVMCYESNYFLYGLNKSKGAKAWIHCVQSKPNHIVLQAPNGKQVKCGFPKR
jgi:hypothetical protein